MRSGKKLFKGFRVSLLLRLLIIILNGTALLWVYLNSDLWTLIFWIALFEIILVVELIRFVEKFKSIGYKYITLDLQGFRSGSMNEVLTEEEKIKHST